MTLRDDLIAAKALIDTPEKWGKGPDGLNCPAQGACAMNACASLPPPAAWYATLALQAELPSGDWNERMLPVAAYNDDPATTHADIMALFDRAIEAAS